MSMPRTDPTTAMSKNAFKNILMALASVTVCLVSLELALRLIDGVPIAPNYNFIYVRAHIANLDQNPLTQYDPALGWVHKANLRLNADHPESSFTTGAFGIRMNEPTIRPLVHDAILAVGDSFTAGSEVGDAGAWPAQLERAIGEPVQNAAVGGWGADQIVLRAEQLLPELEPRVLIISLLSDDTLRNGYAVFQGYDKPYFAIENGVLAAKNQPVPRAKGVLANLGLIRRAFGYSYLVDFTMRRLGVERWFYMAESVKAPTDDIEVSCALLQRLKQETDARGVRLIFLMQWSGTQISEWPTRPNYVTEVLDCARSVGIQTIDSWDLLKGVQGEGQDGLDALYNRLGGNIYSHMSPAGNRFMAELMVKALRDPAYAATDAVFH